MPCASEVVISPQPCEGEVESPCAGWLHHPSPGKPTAPSPTQQAYPAGLRLGWSWLKYGLVGQGAAAARPTDQGALQVFRRVDFDPTGGQLGQHLAHSGGHVLGSTCRGR